MENKNLYNILINANLTDTCYFDSKTFYYDCFGTLANVSAISPVDHQKAATEIKTAFADKIDEIYIHRSLIIVVMKETVLVELGSANAEILHGPDNMELVEALTLFMLQFKLKRRSREIKLRAGVARHLKRKTNRSLLGRLFNYRNF
ncbi:hypothetical protein GFS24_17440 [Chitinophaga sp. SYP-B3965]|uniref:hypothetical protein n=1 Tax=Chitinophaga sp. SYP-B3965 TaxID=2663120 RepID=UPI00129A007F|nr:hypothetical protein [Chitinophaga sp. SYP-B3965]MRG46909.1 hypothetical protein [Chitinophaga sp. SYP-B3965]